MSIRINDWFIAGNAQKTNSDWNATSGYAQILNKPTNLAHTTGDEVISGIKTFSSIPQSVTPETASNDTSVATTEFVTNKIIQHSGDNSAHGDIRQSISDVNNNIATSIDTHNISNDAHSDIRQLISNVNTNLSTDIITKVENHNNNTLSHSDIRQDVNNNSVMISSVSDDLIQETNQRNSDVNNLQQQIDALTSKGDVTDIVGTYQDLLDYDTSTLLNKSIIKVLTDSTHDNTSSYYKWNAYTSAFVYIGSESPTYTKTEIDEMDNAVVHKTGTEEITGQKTFKNTVLNVGKVTPTTSTSTEIFDLKAYDASSNLRGLYQVWRGTNDTTTVIRAFNTSGTSADLRVSVKDDNTVSTFAPTPTAGSNNNNIATTNWCYDPSKSTNLVHRTGDETIAGVKTFTSRMWATVDDTKPIAIKDTVLGIWETPSTDRHRFIGILDKGNNLISYIHAYKTISGVQHIYLQTTNSDNSSTLYSEKIGLQISNTGVVTTYAPTPPAGNNSTQIATTAWCYDPTKSTNLVHRTGDETIAGTKTFSSTINGTAYRAQWGDLAEHYITDEQYPKGTLVQFGGEKEITIAKNKVNAVITSEPGFILNGEMKDSQAIALIGRVPIRVIGKVKKFDKIALSYIDGVGCSNNDSENPIGISLEDKNDSDEGLILCSVKLSF